MNKNEYDIDKTASVLGLTPGVVANIIKEMISTVEEHISRMKTLLEAGDYENLGKTAHKLKGMVANLRFEHMAALAKSVEEKGRAGEQEGYDVLILNIEDAFADMKKVAETF